MTWSLAWGGAAGVSEGSGDVFNRHLQETFWGHSTSLPNASPALWGSPSSGKVLSRIPSVGLLGRCTRACGLRRGFPARSCSAGAACPPPPGRDVVSSVPRWASPLQDTEVSDGPEQEPLESQDPMGQDSMAEVTPAGRCLYCLPSNCILGDLI